MTTKSACLFGAAFVAIFSGTAQAADVSAGRDVVRKLCVNCHIVEPGSESGTVNASVPSFMVIANKDGQTESKLRGFILNPHPPMPEVQLTTRELENITAYILSLKNE